jgi:P4 family phage/plasmid primase-like protien
MVEPITSDIPPTEPEAWLEEPHKPKPENFKEPENYEFAFKEYERKMTIYQARLQLKQANDEGIKEQKERDAKNPFLCLKDHYPRLESFAYYDDEGKYVPWKTAKVAEWIAEYEKFKTDIETGILYFFNGRCWVRNAEPYLKKIISNILREDNKTSHETNIIQALIPLTYAKMEFSQKIALENCLLDVETLETSDFNEKEMPFYEISVTYNKDVDKSKLDNWTEFLKQVANPDDLPLLQEWFGYCLLADYRFHKALWIHGEGRNGKGVFDRTIKGILGLKNVSTVGLEQLDGTQRFVLKDLYGKLYNSSSEPTTNKIFQTEIFQKLTGSDVIKAEFKRKNELIEFTNCSKITIIGNKFPRVTNPTQAFKDRMIFVKFPNHFDDKDQIQKLEQNWLNDPEQKSAILNWALVGLQRLLSQGHFSLTKTQKEMEILFNRVTDNITAFQLEVGIISKNLATTRADTWTAYQNYCEEIGVEARRSSSLTQGMQRLAPKVKDGWIYKPKKERTWVGFGLKNREQTTIEQMEQIEQQSITENFSTQNNNNIQSSAPNVPSVLNEEQLKVVAEESGLRRLEVNKPIWFVKDIPTAEKCECGKFAVTKELLTPTKDTLRRCEECSKKLKETFPNAEWKAAYPDMETQEDA